MMKTENILWIAAIGILLFSLSERIVEGKRIQILAPIKKTFALSSGEHEC